MHLRVYYLDDEVLLLKNFRIFMERKGIEVHTFSEVSAAKEACMSEPPDFLFIDYRLRGTTGDKVAEAVDRSIRKILVTGELSIETADLFFAVLKKPFRLREAYELITADHQ